MQLFFIRHAQSTNNLLWDETGSSKGRLEDPGLSKAGFEQARLLAEHLDGGNPELKNGRNPGNHTGYGLTHLYTSLMLRAVQTGWAISKRIGIPLEGWINLHEGGGVYIEDPVTAVRQGRPGWKRSELSKEFPGLILPAAVTEDGWWNKDYEPWDDRQKRAICLLTELLRLHNHSDDRVALVSHGDFYNAFLYSLFGITIESGIWFANNNASITRIDFGPERIEVVYLNRVDFLPSQLVT